MVFDETIVNNIMRRREYYKLNEVHFNLYEWFDIGDSDEFQFCLNIKFNRATGNVSSGSSVRFRGGRKVYPGRNCGLIDLACIPNDVFDRYRKYQIDHNKARNVRKRKRKLAGKTVSC